MRRDAATWSAERLAALHQQPLLPCPVDGTATAPTAWLLAGRMAENPDTHALEAAPIELLTERPMYICETCGAVFTRPRAPQ